MSHHHKTDGVFFAALLGGTFLMGSSFIAGKVLLQHAEPFPLVGWRFLTAALGCLPFAWFLDFRHGHTLIPPRREWGHIAIIGLLQTGSVMALLFLSMQTLSAATAAIMLFTNPLWVGILAPFVLGEHLSKIKIVGLSIGVAGVALAIGDGVLSGDWVGYAYGLGSALSWSIATLYRKRVHVTVRNWTFSFWQMGIGGLFVLLLAVGQGNPGLERIGGWDWAWFLWLAIPASTGSFGLWFIALARGGASHASGFLFLAPAFTVVLSWVILSKPIGPIQLIGGVLIGASIWMINHSHKKHQKSLVEKG